MRMFQKSVWSKYANLSIFYPAVNSGIKYLIKNIIDIKTVNKERSFFFLIKLLIRHKR